MRRALALSWALGTSTGVLLGLSGVQLVTSGITGLRIAPLSRPEVLQALSAGNTSAPAITAPPASTDIGSAPPLPDPMSKPAPTPPASAPPRPGATAGPTTTTTAPPAIAAPPPAPPPPAPVPPAAKPTTTTTVPKGETRTISSRGGTVAVRYEDAKVRLLWARPNSGYDVVVRDDGPEQVYVRFRSDRARSLVYAQYKNGEPSEEVVERGGGKGDDGGVEPRSVEPVRQQSNWGDPDRWQGDVSRERWRG